MSGNEVEIRVTSKNETKPGFEGAKRDTKSFSDDFDRLITKSLKDGETAFQATTKKAGELRGELNQMRADFAKSGNTGLLPGIKQTEQDLKSLETSVKAMGPELEREFAKLGDGAGREGGRHAGDEFVKGLPFGIGKGAVGVGKAIVSIFDKVTPQVVKDALGLGEKAGKAVADGVVSTADAAATDIPQLFTPEGAIGAGIIAALVGSLAPAAGAAVALAMTLGVGAGVVGIGALIEHNNPKIVAKFGQLKSDIISEMKGAAAPFEDEMLLALDKVDRWRIREAPRLAALFSDAAPGVGILTDGILHFISAVEPGIHKLSQTFTAFLQDPQAKATWDAFADDVNAFFMTMGRHKQLIVDTFTALVSILNAALGVMNALVNAADWLDKAYRKLTAPLTAIWEHNNRIDASSHWVEGQKSSIEDLVPSLTALVDDYDALAGSLSKVHNTADTLAGALTDKVLSGLMRSDQTTLHWEESLTRLGEAFKTNGRQIDIHTAKGQANREAVLAAVQANIDEYDTMIAAGASAKGAAGAYDINTKALEAQLRKAHLTKTQIDELIGSYRGVPKKVNTTIAILGLTKAIEDLNTTLELINGIHGKTVTVHVNTVHGPGPAKASARASGGISGGLHWVGEHGAELVRLPQGSTVYPAGQSQAMAAQQGGAGGEIKMEFVFSGNTDTAMAGAIQNMVRTGKIQLKANGQTVKVG